VATITWSLQALADISEIGLFIERDSAHYAEVIVNRLYSSVDRLIEFPLSGRIVPELDSKSIRELIVEGYRIIYEIENDSIGIVTVISGRQDLRRKLAK
jgi:addiction module RelE/StbE family toxin